MMETTGIELKDPIIRDTSQSSNPSLKHVAIIMDGNGRWAEQRGLERSMGHHAGAKHLKSIIYEAYQIGIKDLSLFCFSTENWKRPAEEIDALFDLLTQYIRLESDELDSWNISVRFIGDIQSLPQKTQESIAESERLLAHNTRCYLNFFVNYGSRAEILAAARALAQQTKEGIIEANDINEELFSRKLLTHGLPDPDLVIRTSGEQRVSNFLLWQIAYAELYISEVLWPDFSAEHFRKACEDFKQRKRRFGDISSLT